MKTQFYSASSHYQEALKRLTSAFTMALFLLCLCSNNVFAQNAKKLGKVKDFHSRLSVSGSASQPGVRSGKKSQVLQTSDSDLLTTIHVDIEKNGVETVMGDVNGSKGSTVYFKFKEGKVTGKAIIPAEKKAYSYATDDNGNVVVTPEDIHNVLCVEYAQPEGAVASSSGTSSAPPSSSPVYNLQSLPGAEAVVMLDFDGEIVSNTNWDFTNPIIAEPYNIDEQGVMEIWKMISEDFRPFNLNITTSETVYNNAPANKRMRCIFTPSNFIGPNTGGIAFIGAFTWGNNPPCWVFNGGIKAGGETGSHEIGHTLGLRHDGRAMPDHPVEEYYAGIGGVWAPIMGSGFSADPVTWSKGEYSRATNTEDDIAIIAGPENGFGFRPDDVGNTIGTARSLFVRTGGVVLATENYGIISTRTDVDVFSFNSTGGTASFNVNGSTSFQNLDIALTLKNANGTVLASANPSGGNMNASISANLTPGTYYLEIDGVASIHSVFAGGYSDYSSLGEYSISGTITSCILSEATPLASNYVVRNSWNDQASGSSVLNESGALKITHRAWGLNELYVIETGKSFNITNGQVYNVKFDFKDFQSIGVAGVDIGFATGLNSQNNGPALVQSLVAAPAGYSSSAFSTKSLNITAAYTGSVKLVFRLRWASQPNTQIVDYIKNINVCNGSGTPSRFADATDFSSNGFESSFAAGEMVFMPNPSTNAFTATSRKEIDMLSVTDVQGTQVYSLLKTEAGSQLQFGHDFSAGFYFVSVIYADGSRESFKVVKTE